VSEVEGWKIEGGLGKAQCMSISWDVEIKVKNKRLLAVSSG